MPIHQRPRKRSAVLTKPVADHKVGDQVQTSPAGERHGELVYHCYSPTDKYVGIIAANALKIAN